MDSKTIRVLQVFNKMDTGGAETMIMNLYRKMDRAKIQFDFLVHKEEKGAFDDEILSYGGRIFHLPKFNGANLVSYSRGCRRFFKQHPEIDIVHGHISSPGAIYLSIARRYGCRTIAHSHNTNKDLKHRIATFPTRYIAEHLFACSELAGIVRYGRHTWEKKQGIVLNNGLDVDEYKFRENVRDEYRKKLGVEGKFVLGHVGRLDPQKNHVYLLRVFERLRELRPDSVLLLIGNGSLREQLKATVQERHMQDQVFFLGIRRDIPACLMAMDAFVFPSLYEGLPVTVVEAQAAGLPCFISDTITTETAITDLVRFRSIDVPPEQWAEELAEFAPAERKDMSAVITEKGYSVASTAAWLTDYYTKLAKGALD